MDEIVFTYWIMLVIGTNGQPTPLTLYDSQEKCQTAIQRAMDTERLAELGYVCIPAESGSDFIAR